MGVASLLAVSVLDFSRYPLWINAIAATVAAAVVWYAGWKLSEFANVVAERKGLRQAFVGVLLLAGGTTLPEIATTTTASAIGNAPLAVNNLFGGVILQITLVAIADVAAGSKPLSSLAYKPVLVLQGVFLVLVLGLSIAGIALGGTVSLFGVGFWPPLLFVVYFVAVYLSHRFQLQDGRQVERDSSDRGDADSAERRENEPGGNDGATGDEHGVGPTDDGGRGGDGRGSRHENLSTHRAAAYLVAAALAILVAGFVVARSADAIARQTGLGSSFVGVVLLALITSLPEVSATTSAVRLGAHRMAVSDLLGSNLMEIALIFLSDLVYRQGAVLAEVGRFLIVAAVLGIVITSIYLVGLVVRSEKTILRMGIASVVAILVYVAGLGLLYLLR